MRTATEIRSDFLLDPEIAHLSHGSFGATPRPVLERQRELRNALERDPVEFLGRRLPELRAGVRSELAVYVGVADPEHLVLVANATTALNAVATSLHLAPGDEIVVTDREYGAMELLWTEVARRAPARLVVANVPLPAGGDSELVEAVWSAVRLAPACSSSATSRPRRRSCYRHRSCAAGRARPRSSLLSTEPTDRDISRSPSTS